MSNQFENTYKDLLQCLNNMNNELSERETEYKERLVDVCREIIDEYELSKISEDDDDGEAGFEFVINKMNEYDNEEEDDDDDEFEFVIFEFENNTDDEPEYDGAGFTYEDRVVNGEYMNTQDNKDNNNDDEDDSDGKTDYVPWDLQTK